MSHYDSNDDFEQIRERPSWVLPLAMFAVTIIMGLFVWWYYLGYTVDDLLGNTLAGTERGRILHVAIGGQPLEIPANYTQFPKDRRDGSRDSIELFTVLPDFAPYSRGRRDDFTDTGSGSPVIIFKIDAHRVAMTENERVERYLETMPLGDGVQTDFGLTEYGIDERDGFRNQDLFVFQTTVGLSGMIRCLRKTETIRAPFCWRETELGNGLTLHYRFRRSHLTDWRKIDRGILDLVEKFIRVDRMGTNPSGEVVSDAR